MAYRLIGHDALISEGILPTEDGLQAYGMIGDPAFDNLIDELLHERSVCEFLREQLSHEQDADLEKVDIFWQSHASQFNVTFAVWHNLSVAEKGRQMIGWVEPDHAMPPTIPRHHWWWWPIDPEKGDAS